MAPTLFDHPAKPGDLIQIFRGSYEHWAVYIGRNKVVHLLPAGADVDSEFGSLGLLLDSTRARVRCQNIWEVVCCDTFEVNNFLDDEYVPREPHVIVKQAREMVGHELPYSLTSSNCEHFATWLRYGKPESRQVKTAAAVGGAALAGVGIVALGAAIFSLFQEDSEKRHHKRQQ